MLKDITHIKKVGTSHYILIPSTVFKDSNFKFKEGDRLLMKANKGIILLGKVKDG